MSRRAVRLFSAIALLVAARVPAAEKGGLSWWSLQKLPDSVEVPPSTADGPVKNAIDAFIGAELKKHDLSPAPPAGRADWLRRVTFDLTGLPPTPAETDSFLADASPTAAEKAVERLLASPAYGERWARHWLDVARFGESDGFEFDKPRFNAWPYRDWVIEALNADMPYPEFARLQIAGDTLLPDRPDGVIPTGFLVGGPYDDTNKVTASELLRANMRQDELEDIVGTVGQVFLGLTTHCARCHDHKIDPVSTADYYSLASCFSGLQRGERTVATTPATAPTAPLADVKPLMSWDFDSAEGLEFIGGARIENGALVLDGDTGFARTGAQPTPLREKTLTVRVQVTNPDVGGGAALSVQTLEGTIFDAVVYAEREPRKWMAGSDLYSRTQPFQGIAEPAADFIQIDLVYYADGTIAAFRNGMAYGKPYVSKGLQTFEPGRWQVLLGLRHGVEAQKGRMLAAKIDWARLYDRPLWPKPNPGVRVYALTPTAAGPVPVLDRGDPKRRRDVAPARGLPCIAGLKADFSQPPEAPENERRRAFAEWLTQRNNSLFWRTMANRVWHWHFGKGLVSTPNDLGFNGGAPSHPALLDWLAVQLRDSGGSLKKLHRLMVTSATYAQASHIANADARRLDAQNRLLWHMTPTRLDAESLRDATLSVAGVLDPRPGGPGFQDFRMENTANTMHYLPLEEDRPAFHRRSIYRMAARGGTPALLGAFDCPDSSISVPARAATVTPLNALTLLNDSFTLDMAGHTARRLEKDAGADPAARIARLWQLAYARKASERETADAIAFAGGHGWPALCRAVFNSSEFVTLP